ncbi:efflux RND transporter permease subunit [Salinigranum halophilum]|uniref:efflux RND transporter permease subunit n=1 Tax=Salinigranum halophilum TaxID=2565931 RepID=UPI00115C77BF|nr:RND family transporter [Salinigranum halophilum]
MDLLRSAFARVGNRIQKRPLLTLVVVVSLIVVAGAGASQITSVTGNQAFVDSNPTLERFEDTFDRGTMAVLVRGDVTEPATMRAIDTFDRRMETADRVVSVLTPADQVRAEYGRIPDSQAQIERVVGDRSSTVVTVVLESGLTQEEQRPVYEDALDARSWAAFPAGTEVVITGQPAFSAQLSVLIQQSTQQLLGLAVGLMVIALFFLFRGVRLRLLPIVAVFVGVIYTFGAMGYLGIPNSTLTSAVFPILIGLGIDYSVQFHQRYEEELERAPPSEALPAALAGIGPAVLVAMLAAALGFGATWVATLGVPAFEWFAQTSILGVMLSFMTGIFLLTPVLTLWVRWRYDAESTTPRPAVDDDDELSDVARFLGRGARFFASHPALILAIAGLLTVGGFYAGESLGTLADFEEFFPQDLPAYVNLQQFRAVSGGGDAARYDIIVSGTDLRDPETLRWMERFSAAAAGSGQIVAVESPATVVAGANGGEIPATEAGVERALDRVPPERRQQFYTDGYAHIVVIAESDITPRETLSLIRSIESALELSQPPAGVEADLTGTAVISTPSVIDQIESRDQITGYGVLAVFVLLLLYYRDPVKALAPLIPMLFVVGWQNIYMAAFDIRVSPLGASLGALSVGIGAEYTVIVMERYFEEKRRGADPLDAIETAGARVGKAITISGMTTVFGFSALTLSPFPIIGDFGYLTVGVIFLTLVAAITTLPPVLVVLDQLRMDVRSWLDSDGVETVLDAD